MRSLLLITSLFFLVASPSGGEAFQGEKGCVGDCSTCHSLTEEEAGKLLNIEKVKISEAPAKGIWQVEGQVQRKVEGKVEWLPVTIYLDYAKKFAFQTQQFIPVASIGKAPKEITHLDPEDVPLTGTMLLGSKKAKHKIIVFDDPDCPFCRKLHKEIKGLIKKRKDIAFYIKLYPLPMHKDAYVKSKAILCDKSLELLDAAFEGKAVPAPKCETLEVGKNIALAKKLGVTGTPTFVFPDGRVHAGYLDAKGIVKKLEEKK